MNKYFIYCRPFNHILKYKRLYPLFNNNIPRKTIINTFSTKTPNTSYWSIFEENNHFLFSLKTSESAIKDGPFINQLFKQALISTPTNSNSSSDRKKNKDLIYHCYDIFQTLDMPDKLIYIKYLQKQRYYIPFLYQLYQLPNGIKYLIDLRFILLKLLKQYPNEYPHLEELEIILKDKLRNWVSDHLSIQQITWQSSAEIIEKICQYEAVHTVQNLKDIKRRLGPDRRVFALFSKSSPMEPLVFIHVALLPTLATNIQTILQSPMPTLSSHYGDDDDHHHEQYDDNSYENQQFKYAICYSITTQQGLGGIHLGNHLIKYVIHQLQSSYPHLHTLATLSPIPGFRHWLLTQTNLVDELCDIGGFHWENRVTKVPTDHPLKAKLLEFCARYILKEKRENSAGGGCALDPVANFHLRNGACVHKLHWLGDTSRKGLNESFGMMVNYKYIPSLMDHHHQLYVNDNIIVVSEKTLSCLSDFIDHDHVLKLKM
ncbi:unnamed protein product [Cunninghamella blakesleeana]